MTEVKRTDMMGRVVIAGGSGFLGQNLAKHLTNLGWEVVVISRHGSEHNGRWQDAVWDGRTLGDWIRHLDGATALVNLAGRTVDCIKTPANCDEILRSRVESTEVLGRALQSVKTPPRVWVQMSTAHIYGDPPEVVCDENSAFGWGLAPFVAREWEEAFARALPSSSVRQVILRTSFVLGKNGGALRRLGKLVRFGLGGTVGHGRQGISWIHEQDMDRLFERAMTDESMHGPYIATAPNPVANAEFNNAGGTVQSKVQYLNFKTGKGVLFLTQYSQDVVATPVNNEELTCDFQGLSNDGKYYVAARFAITHPSLPKGIDSTKPPPADPDGNYLKKQEQLLNRLADDTFQPSLTGLRSLIASITTKSGTE
jgi:hypothetical protein